MSEPRRSTRARAREEAAPAAEPEIIETPSKQPTKSLKRKRTTTTVKDTTPSTPVVDRAQHAPRYILPSKVIDGQPLPTLPEPQPLSLPSHEYQDVRQSGVLGASFQRSRAVWISGSNFRLFHAFFTPPKKVADRSDEDKQAIQRQKDIIRNLPMIGSVVPGDEAQLVIEPHTFKIRIYGAKEFIRQTQKRPPPQYGQWPNHSHNQYSPYPQQQPHYNNSTPAPYAKPIPPQPRPSQPKPQKPPPPGPGATTTPAPDPVIHMLAQRAGTDPELKAVMKIVAAGQATQQQLSFFQGHISELTRILEKQKEEAARMLEKQKEDAARVEKEKEDAARIEKEKEDAARIEKEKKEAAGAPPPLPPAAAPPALPAPPVASGPPPQTPQTSQALHAPQAPHVAVPRTPYQQPQPPPQQQNHYHQQQHTPKPYHPPATPGSQQHVAPPHIRHTPHPNQYTNAYSQHQQHVSPYNSVSQPPRTSFKPLVFDFKEGNGDKFYFPSYSYMEWLPNNQGMKFSFLITKMKPKPKPEPKETAPATPAPKVEPMPPPASVPNATPNTPVGMNPINNASTPLQTAPPIPKTPQYVPPPRIEDFDEKNDIKDIEFYQPVTIVVLSKNIDILQALPRAVRPPDVVEKYMNEVFDTCKRADDSYLAFRLPKEGVIDVDSQDRNGGENIDVAPAVSTPAADVIMGGTGAVSEKKKPSGRARSSLVA